MKNLKDFLAGRRVQIASEIGPLVDERAKLDTKIERLRTELAEIDRAAQAVGLERRKPEGQLIAEHRHTPPMTIKEAVLLILSEHSEGLTALEILAEINARFALGIVRTSLSPQLSRLKNDDKKIEIYGSTWRLFKHEGPAK
ncbi:MAG TPA: hypothetical protein VMV19_08700 [Xanthobacteraceae bacterium]|nr:hypothetical protein [Xanthobacteraceae bacterium]